VIRKPAAILLALSLAVFALALVPAAGLAAKGGNSGVGATSSACSVSPSQVVLDQVWTVSAWGLPTSSTVNMRITFPDGATSVGPVPVASDGTFTTTGNSNMSADWGVIPPEQTGTYKYQFVNRVKWPSGTFTKSYAECSVAVS
jgi:hypothetical protein